MCYLSFRFFQTVALSSLNFENPGCLQPTFAFRSIQNFRSCALTFGVLRMFDWSTYFAHVMWYLAPCQIHPIRSNVRSFLQFIYIDYGQSALLRNWVLSVRPKDFEPDWIWNVGVFMRGPTLTPEVMCRVDEKIQSTWNSNLCLI